jgi:hypothetical protein
VTVHVRKLSPSDAKTLLGWREVEKDGAFKDRKNIHIVCDNNVSNRPLYMSTVDALEQEILRGKFRLNCENLIIGEKDSVLNGQHRLIGLVFAGQRYEIDPDGYKEYWDNEPYIETTIAFGASEDDEVVNTMDTCKPRTLMDVIYRSPFFIGIKGSDRKRIARATDYAVRLLWHRSGAAIDAFAPRRTHSESLDFIARHEKILECVKFVYEEEGDTSRISKFLSLGYAAAMLYLMSSCNTDPEPYRTAEHPNEGLLDFGCLDQAQDFFVTLADNKNVRAALEQLSNDEVDSLQIRQALVAKAWNVFVDGKNITPKSIELEFDTDPDSGESVLVEFPSVGGIDMGDPSESRS